MGIIRFFSRVPEAEQPQLAAHPLQEPSWPIHGDIHPNLCPAIQHANRTGVLITALHGLDFHGPDDFDVMLAATPSGVVVVPGVIGSPNCFILFAKVDTGFSVEDLEIDLLSVPVLNLEYSLNLIVPGIIYPIGYSGPIFIAVAARQKISLSAGYPLAQLISMDSRDHVIEISHDLSTSRRDAYFEGLLRPGWREAVQRGRKMKATECLTIFRQEI